MTTRECSQCGAILSTDTMADQITCEYCGLTVTLEEAASSEKLLLCLPALSEKEAQDIFRKESSSARLAPNDFKKNPPKAKFNRVLVPFYHFDFEAHSQWTGEKKVEDQIRLGKVKGTQTSKRSFSGTHTKDYHRVSCATGQFSKEANRAFNIATGVTQAKHQPAPQGWSVSQIVASSQQASAILRDEVRAKERQSCEKEARRQRISNIRCSTRINQIGTERIFYLPFWLGKYKYKGKSYTVTVRADSGEIHCSTPISHMKAGILLLVVITALLFTICDKEKDNTPPTAERQTAEASVSTDSKFLNNPDRAILRLFITEFDSQGRPFDPDGLPDSRGTISIGGKKINFPTQKDSQKAEIPLNAILSANDKIQLELHDDDGKTSEPIGSAIGTFTGKTPLFLLVGESIAQILTQQQTVKDYSFQDFLVEAPSLMIDNKLDIAKKTKKQKEWIPTAFHAGWIMDAVKRGWIKRGDSRVSDASRLMNHARKKIRQAKMSEWGKTIRKKGQPIELKGVKTTVTRARIVEFCKGPNELMKMIGKDRLEPQHNGYYVVVNLSEKNQSNETMINATNISGFGNVKYRLIDTLLNEHPFCPGLADCMTKSLNSNVPSKYTREQISVEPNQTWKYSKYFIVPSTISRNELFLEVSEESEKNSHIFRIPLF